MLNNPAFFRRDVTEGGPGLPLTLTITVVNTRTSCGPLADAAVEIWQCDAAGNYSECGQSSGQTFLRGLQTTDSGGKVTFNTIYPGWYGTGDAHPRGNLRERPHCENDTDRLPGKYLGFRVSDRRVRVEGLNTTTNASDNVFSDGVQDEMAALSRVTRERLHRDDYRSECRCDDNGDCQEGTGTEGAREMADITGATKKPRIGLARNKPKEIHRRSVPPCYPRSPHPPFPVLSASLQAPSPITRVETLKSKAFPSRRSGIGSLRARLRARHPRRDMQRQSRCSGVGCEARAPELIARQPGPASRAFASLLIRMPFSQERRNPLPRDCSPDRSAKNSRRL